jgi:hypothetical protein
MNPEQSKSEVSGKEISPAGQQGTARERRPYEPPCLVAFGHVRELTAGKTPGISDITSAGSII